MISERKIYESILEDVKDSIEQKPLDDYADTIANKLLGINNPDDDTFNAPESDTWKSESFNELNGFEVPECFISGGDCN